MSASTFLRWPLFASLALLSACSFVAPAFVRNLSAQSVTVYLLGAAAHSGPEYLPYVSRVLPYQQLRIQHLSDSLPVAADSGSIRFTLPSRATVNIGAFQNGISSFQAIFIERPGKPTERLEAAALPEYFALRYRLGGCRACLDLR